LLVIVDTNVLLVSVSDRSKFHWVYKTIIEKKINIAFSNDILTEYEEQIAAHWHPEVAANVKVANRTFYGSVNSYLFQS